MVNVAITYQRYDPDTICGDKIEVKYVYSSMNTHEIDCLEEQFKSSIGTALRTTIDMEKGNKDS